MVRIKMKILSIELTPEIIMCCYKYGNKIQIKFRINPNLFGYQFEPLGW